VPSYVPCNTRDSSIMLLTNNNGLDDKIFTRIDVPTKKCLEYKRESSTGSCVDHETYYSIGNMHLEN
jgi:hypothetical protein